VRGVDPGVDGVGLEVQQQARRLVVGPRASGVAAAAAEENDEGEGGDQPSYQWTPFMRLAIAICSTDAFSFGSFSPLAAAESGKTL
jgi:hypothetical protein